MAGRGNVKLSIYSTFKDDGTKKAERALTQFAKKYGQVEKATGKVKLNAVSKQLAEQSIKWDRLSQKCQKFSTTLGKASKAFAPFSAAAAAALGGSVKLASDFETSMAKVATITDKSVISMEEMANGLLDVSNQTGIAVTELAEAAYQAQSASVDSAHAVEFVATASKLARSGFTETATAVDVLTTAINAYGLEATDAESIADKLVQTQNMGKTTVNELAASIGQAIPSAAAYGVNLDNLLTAYVQLTKQGINTANATTYLNGMMTELSKEGTKVSDSLHELTGKGFNELMAEGYSVADVLGIIYDSVGRDSTEFANLWGNVRAGKGALAIVNGGIDEFDSQLQGMAKSAGNMDSALEDLETPAVKAQKALNSLKNTGILLGQEVLAQVAPALEKLVEKARELFERFQKMPKSTKQTIVKLLEVTAAIAPLLKLASVGVGIFGKFAGGMGKITANLAKFAAKGGTAASVAGKLGTLLKGPVMLGIMAAAAAIAFIVKKVLDWKKKQENLVKATTGLEKACKSLDPTLADEAKALGNLGTETGKVSADVDGLIEKQAQLADTISERNTDARASIAMLEAAKDTIDQYANATGLTAEEQGKLQAAIALVNDECGTQYTVTDAVNGVIQDEAGNIVKTTDAIDEYIDKKKEQIRLEAITENLKDLYKQQYEAQQTLNDATEEYNQALRDQAKYGNESSAAAAQYAGKVQAAEGKVNAAKAALDTCNKSLANGEKEMAKATKATQKLGGEMGKAATTAKTKGANVATNFASGIIANSGKAAAAASTMASDAKSAATVSTYGLGLDFANGFKLGIMDGASKVATAAKNMVTNAMNAAKNAQKSGSPSKKMMQMGEWFGEGYEIGIEDTTRDVAYAARGMANAALGQFGQRPAYAGAYGGSVTNIYLDGARLNDDPAIRRVTLDFLTELQRLSHV